MKFNDALHIMKNGGKVKLPSWGGYWYWNHELNTIMIHDKNNLIMDIRETQCVEYTLTNVISDKWIEATESNTPVLGGIALFDFDEAVKYMKRNIKVKRYGWVEGVTLDSTITFEDTLADDWMFV